MPYTTRHRWTPRALRRLMRNGVLRLRVRAEAFADPIPEGRTVRPHELKRPPSWLPEVGWKYTDLLADGAHIVIRLTAYGDATVRPLPLTAALLNMAREVGVRVQVEVPNRREERRFKNPVKMARLERRWARAMRTAGRAS